MPTACSGDTTDCQELSCYVLEDVLACPVGCHLIICIHANAHGNPTQQSYSDQAMHISDSRKTHNNNTEFWRITGDQYFVIQGTIRRATLHDKIQSCNLLWGRFLKYCDNRSGDIGVGFDGCDTILSISWLDIIGYSHIIMFLASHLTNRVNGDRFSDSKLSRIRTSHFLPVCVQILWRFSSLL